MKRLGYRCLLCLVAVIAIPAWIAFGMIYGAADGWESFRIRFMDQWGRE